MIVGDQSEVIEFLKTMAGPGVELVFTHASVIFLAGNHAFKLKRAVCYSYLDFSTPEKRLSFCRAELELNRRTAPSLYLGVRIITRNADGRLGFDGPGSLVDAIVEMRRFSQDHLFDNMAQKGTLTAPLITLLAYQVAALHKQAPISHTHGGKAGISAILELNRRAFMGTMFDKSGAAKTMVDCFRRSLVEHAERLDMRRDAGKVRRCHGDLILRNICLIDGRPTVFDCLEFDEGLATIDVLYDLAFLLVDLWHRDQRVHANLVHNRYLDECDETDGLSLIPFFMAIRAAVRAHVTATQAADAQAHTGERLRTEAQAYFDLAMTLLRPAGPMLLAIGGFSGSGKSTMASLVAPFLGPPPGARILNSDRIRKRMFDVAPEQTLPASAYQPEFSKRVYEELKAETAEILATGTAVIADAVFDRPGERRAIRSIAEAAQVPFHGFWLEAPEETLIARISKRHGDPSDATAAVVADQIARGCGAMEWERIDATVTNHTSLLARLASDDE
jgi:uncharacterized protein